MVTDNSADDQTVLMGLLEQPAPIGVYVHFPWCLHKCPYCDFVSFALPGDEIPHRDYADAVIAELEQRAEDLAGHTLRSVFFGGGTPSLWQPRQLGRVLRRIFELAESGSPAPEVSVECNPSSLDEAAATALCDVGVNRLSIGVQGLNRERLAYLERLHDGDEALGAVRAALKAGVPRVSADLIYGVASGSQAAAQQSPEQAADEAGKVAELGVTHISVYALTIEPNTRFGELSRQGRLPLVDEGWVAESFLAVGDTLGAHGFERYEISNFAQPGERSVHNLNYWRGYDYMGLGCGAYGAKGGSGGWAQRYRNPPTPTRYFQMVADGKLRAHEVEQLDPEARMRERLMLGLRLAEGVDIEAAARELGVVAWPEARKRAADALFATGRLEQKLGRMRIPPESWLWADDTACRLF